MENKTVFDHMIMLDEEEKMGYAYYKETGVYLDYIFLTFLKSQPNPYDFSVLLSEQAQKYHDDVLNHLTIGLSGILNEQVFIETDANAEIQHLPRYVDIAAHRHDFFEIVCTLQGQCLHRVEGAEVIMKQGDITIIPPHIHHYLRAEPDCITLTIKIRRSTLDSVFSVLMRSGTTLSAYFAKTLYSQHYRNSLTFHCGNDTFLPQLLYYMFSQQAEKKRHYHRVIEGLLSTFFPYLVQNYENSIEFSIGDSSLNERIIDIENYIRQYYDTATLQSVAKHFYLSPSYLSTLIKKQTGATFSSILCRIRMEHAAELLTDTDMKVEQICEKIGYADPTQFIRTFKVHFGTTPLQYRKR